MDAGAGCIARMELSGCLPLRRCAVPAVDRCKYDFSSCATALLWWGGGGARVPAERWLQVSSTAGGDGQPQRDHATIAC